MSQRNKNINHFNDKTKNYISKNECNMKTHYDIEILHDYIIMLKCRLLAGELLVLNTYNNAIK